MVFYRSSNNMQDEVKSVCVLPHIIFVYGTLKRGQPNGHVLEEFGNHQFLGTGCTDLKYPLVIDKDANLPFMLDAPGKGQVHGIFVANALVSMSFFKLPCLCSCIFCFANSQVVS